MPITTPSYKYLVLMLLQTRLLSRWTLPLKKGFYFFLTKVYFDCKVSKLFKCCVVYALLSGEIVNRGEGVCKVDTLGLCISPLE